MERVAVTNERILEVHRLYREHHTLNGAAHVIGVSREWVRQLLFRGARRGLFRYPPRKVTLSKEQLLEGLRRLGALTRVAREHGTTTARLKHLCERYGISRQERKAIVAEWLRRKCIESFKALSWRLGHNPSTLEIQRGGKDIYKGVLRFWGSIRAFRDDLAIPQPPHGGPRMFKYLERMKREAKQRFEARAAAVMHELRAKGTLSRPTLMQAARLTRYQMEYLLRVLVKERRVLRPGRNRYRMPETSSLRPIRET